MVDVAKALGRPPSYTTKYFGCELGAQSKFDEKTGTSHVNGAHETAKLASLLEIFIKKYVQCHKCGNPETEILISKTQMITLKCSACGYVSDVDMRDKLTTFILKNPPEKKAGKDKKALRRAEKERLKAGEAADEDIKKGKKDSKKKSHESSLPKASKKKTSSDEERSPVSQDEGDNDDDDVQWLTDTSAEAVQQRIKEQLNSVTSEMVILENLDDHKKDKSNNVSVKNEEHKFDSKFKGEVQDNVSLKQPGKDAEIEPNLKELHELSIHDELVLSLKDKIKKKTYTPNQIASFMQSKDSSPQEVMNAYFEALFEGAGKGFSKEVSKKKQYLTEVVQDENSQMLFLRAIDAFCNHARVEAVKEVSLVLKFLYDQDVLEEEIIYEWFDKGSADVGKKASPIWKNVKPFVEWLKNAEAESEED